MKGPRFVIQGLAALIALAAPLAVPAGAGAAVEVDSSEGRITVNAVPSGGADENGIVFDWDLDHPDYISFFSPVPDPGSPRTAPDALLTGGDCVPATANSGEPEVRCPLSWAFVIQATMWDGDDSFTGSASRDSELIPRALFPIPISVDGGHGADFLQAAGRGSAIVGGGGDDLMIARYGGSLMVGGGGNDHMIAPEGGNERMYGGGGGDVLEGFQGDDFLNGQTGRDVLLGGSGGDRLDARDGLRDKRVKCGGGRGDQGRLDVGDPPQQGCEFAKRYPGF